MKLVIASVVLASLSFAALGADAPGSAPAAKPAVVAPAAKKAVKAPAKKAAKVKLAKKAPVTKSPA